MGQYLGGGQQQRLLNVFRPPLGGGVKLAHGVDLVVKELAPHRLVHQGREHVQDAAPQGELAHALHLPAPDVPGGGQVLGQLVQIADAADAQLPAAPLQRVPGHGPLEKALHRGHQEGVFPLGQPPHQRQPPVLPLAGEGGGVVEGEVPGAQHRDSRSGEGGQVPGQLLPLPLVGAHHHHGPLGNQADAGGHGH